MPTVLVVDDHPGFRSRARLLLEADGYEVVGEAADGEAAVAEARRLEPDLVLLDVQLPDLDGFEVAARLTGAEAPPAVVLTSSRDWSDSPELLARSGASGFLAQGPALRGDDRGADRLRSLRLALIGLGLAGFVAGLLTPSAGALERLPRRRQGRARRLRPVDQRGHSSAPGSTRGGGGPGNNFGPLMTAIGFVWAVRALEASEVEGLFVIGRAGRAPVVRAASSTCWSRFRGGGCRTRTSGFWSGSPTSTPP